jgi:hypothetical protein
MAMDIWRGGLIYPDPRALVALLGFGWVAVEFLKGS